MEREIELDMFEDFLEIGQDTIEKCVISKNDIAIVGLSVRAGAADSAETLWSALSNGEDLTAEIPYHRAADADAFARFLGRTPGNYVHQSYLQQIDRFSPSFFHIPPTDAALIDPAQRLFMQTAWRALEDAGISKSSLDGSDTGVFVGYTPSPESYSELLSQSDPEYADRAVSGKVNSMIASRLSYYLNLRGPAIMVDTACSSSLVAVHLACNSLRSGECQTAIVGGVKYTLLPEKAERSGEITVASADGRTRTFDVNADGTNPGEGVGVVILKPLCRAQEDKDHIYAVIKGSAVNQDGASVGITAPNAAAQEAVIVKAWENAGIDPEKVSYMEAHGTATKLGDPVEVSGIERAFRRYTDKKQFCAIGSVKTNLGHLDCAAGIVGLIKCVLSLTHKMLPPQLYFTSPNREIDFIASPVYVNDRLTPWVTGEEERICGVSSFGLSGTNCHVVLQEYSAEPAAEARLPMILPLSARNKAELIAVSERFAADALAMAEQLPNCIYTAAVAKSEYAVRFATVVESIEDIRNLPQRVRTEVSEARQAPKRENDPAAQELMLRLRQDPFAERGAMEALCRLYTEGAEVDWRELYEAAPVTLVPLTGYPMREERCWASPKLALTQTYKTENDPLIDQCLTASPTVYLYTTMLSEHTHSEVREHIIGEMHVLAGTVYVEMLRCAASKAFGSEQLRIDNLVFLSAMVFEEEQCRETQVLLYRKTDATFEASIQSRPAEGGDWTVHIRATVSLLEDELPQRVKVQELLGRMGEDVMDSVGTQVEQLVTTGPRWKVQRWIRLGEGEALTMAEMDAQYADELERYFLYPSMLDAAVNCSSVLNGNIFCLPYYYGSMRIYRKMPQRIYSHTVKKQDSSSEDGEIHVFDVTVFDENGEVIATVHDYAMKKAGSQQTKRFFRREEPSLRTIQWVRDSASYRASDLTATENSIVLIKDINNFDKKLYNTISSSLKESLYELNLCDWEAKNSARRAYVFPEEKEGMVSFFGDMEHRGLSRVIFLVPNPEEPKTAEELHAATERLMHAFFNLIYALASDKALGSIEVDVLIQTEDGCVSPAAMAVAGMGKSMLFEYSRLKLRCILYSKETLPQRVTKECSCNHNDYMVWLRGEARYVPQMAEMEQRPVQAFRPTRNGTYLITGGTGGIGLTIAAHFAELEPSVRLILTARSRLLPEEQWEGERGETYRKLCALRRKAASVTYIPCDVADEAALHRLAERAGTINGIVHAAGLPGGGFVIQRQWKDFQSVLAPKISGTWNLIRLARQESMEFIVLFSSYSTVLAVAGQSDYIGANSFMEAYASWGNADKRVKVLNWSGWRECGMALKNGVDMEHSPVCFLSNAEGAELFSRAMAAEETQILIGKLNYNELAKDLEDYGRIVRFTEDDLGQIRSSADSRKHTNQKKNYDITVRGKDSPLTPTEQKLAQAWAKILGLREVDYQDKFLEIGGDSLSATYLQKEIDTLFPNVMDITDVFVYPSIARMAEYIDSKTAAAEQKRNPPEADTEQMKKMLEMLASGEIDVSEAGKLLF